MKTHATPSTCRMRRCLYKKSMGVYVHPNWQVEIVHLQPLVVEIDDEPIMTEAAAHDLSM